MKSKSTSRDTIDTILPWIIGTSFIALMVTVSILAPLLYVWVIGLPAVVGVFILTLAVGSSLMSSGSFFDAIIGWQVIEGGFRLIGVIFIALVSATSND